MKAGRLKGRTALEIILDPNHKRHQMLICGGNLDPNLDPDPNLARIHARDLTPDLDPAQGHVLRLKKQTIIQLAFPV